MSEVKIIRGTTPTVVFHITDANLDFSLIDNAHIIFYSIVKQIVKGLDDIDIDAETRNISTTLTQEETYAVREGKVDVQLRLHVDDGSDAGLAMATPISSINIRTILEEQVITKDE